MRSDGEGSGRIAFTCPKAGCYYHLALEPGASTDHRCPYNGGSTYAWSVTVGLVEEIWAKLDRCVDTIKNPEAAASHEWAKAQASAYADTLTLFMRPLFNTVEEISREAGRRHKARRNGEEYETPGIRHAKYKTMMDGDVWYKSVTGAWTDDPRRAAGEPVVSDDAIINRQRGIIAVALETGPLDVNGPRPLKSIETLAKESQPKVEHNFTEEEVEKLKAFHAGGFSPEDLARIHGVKVEVIRSALSI